MRINKLALSVFILFQTFLILKKLFSPKMTLGFAVDVAAKSYFRVWGWFCHWEGRNRAKTE